MISVSASAMLIALQIPLIPNQSGSVRTMMTWNTNVLRNEMTADIRPLFSAEDIDTDDQECNGIYTEAVQCHSVQAGIVTDKYLR